ncbi:hypothetical protein BaRGS_00019659 [Batillaria attramentaria]|uniref:Uncharacterized protein n=1 Tax=Batillaria attramentaria TaxID=370345 RepID=A0ABD0KQZ1_9CAEN
MQTATNQRLRPVRAGEFCPLRINIDICISLSSKATRWSCVAAPSGGGGETTQQSVAERVTGEHKEAWINRGSLLSLEHTVSKCRQTAKSSPSTSSSSLGLF